MVGLLLLVPALGLAASLLIAWEPSGAGMEEQGDELAGRRGPGMTRAAATPPACINP